jgi:hypothetical protein
MEAGVLWRGRFGADSWSVAIPDECLVYAYNRHSGGVQHQSPHNLSEKTRFIYTFHMISDDASYDDKNW